MKKRVCGALLALALALGVLPGGALAKETPEEAGEADSAEYYTLRGAKAGAQLYAEELETVNIRLAAAADGAVVAVRYGQTVTFSEPDLDEGILSLYAIFNSSADIVATKSYSAWTSSTSIADFVPPSPGEYIVKYTITGYTETMMQVNGSWQYVKQPSGKGQDYSQKITVTEGSPDQQRSAAALAQYIEQNGAVEEGKPYIESTYVNNGTATAKVTYEGTSNLSPCFRFQYVLEDEKSSTVVNLLYKEGAETADVVFGFGVSSGAMFISEGTLDVASYSGKAALMFKKLDNPSYVYPSNYNSLSNAGVDAAAAAWDLLLLEKAGMELRDLGFTSYRTGQIEPEPPAPTVLASGECGGSAEWTLYSDGLLNITGSGMMSNFEFAGAPWYEYRKNIKGARIGNSIQNIGNYGFYGCLEMEKITISDSVRTIGKNAFWSCDKLREAALPSGLASIGDRAFDSCSALAEIVIPSSVSTVGEFAFYRCGALEKVTIQDGVGSIGADAFCRCENLRSIVIPDSVRELGFSAFKECGALTDVTLSRNLPYLNDGLFENCVSLRSVEIPEGIEKIGWPSSHGVFSGCALLEKVSIPRSVTSIGKNSFSGCRNLQIYYAGTEEEWNGIEIDYSQNPEISLDRIHFRGSAATLGKVLELVDYICENGIRNSSGNGAYITKTYTQNNEKFKGTITYSTDLNTLVFHFQMGDSLFVTFNYDVSASAAGSPVRVNCIPGQIGNAFWSVSSEFDIGTYNGDKTPLTFTLDQNDTTLGKPPANYNEFCNSAVRLAVPVWGLLLTDTVKMTLRDIGFEHYGTPGPWEVESYNGSQVNFYGPLDSGVTVIAAHYAQQWMERASMGTVNGNTVVFSGMVLARGDRIFILNKGSLAPHGNAIILG